MTCYLVVSFVIFAVVSANAQAFSESFDVVNPLPTGWSASNQSTVIGSSNWFQGNTAVFNSQTGATNSYLGANFNNASGTNTTRLITLNEDLTGEDFIGD